MWLPVLKDFWILNVGGSLEREDIQDNVVISGRKWHSPRGYHTANLAQNVVVVVVGGSNGCECLWRLKLGASHR